MIPTPKQKNMNKSRKDKIEYMEIKKRCGWSKTRFTPCRKKPILEMESLLGTWSPICKYHLEQKKRNTANNPWGALFEIKTRELSHD